MTIEAYKYEPQIVCSQHGGCNPSECFELHYPHASTRRSPPDPRCGFCRTGDHERCDASETLGRVDRCCCGIANGPSDRADPDAPSETE